MIKQQNIMKALEFLDKTSTYIVPLDADDEKNNWAMVFGWIDDGDTSDIYGKIAYQPKNSLMREYDIDWLMPVDKNGEVDDTEMIISTADDIDYLIDSWDRIKREREL